jgi:hypothetical protein
VAVARSGWFNTRTSFFRSSSHFLQADFQQVYHNDFLVDFRILPVIEYLNNEDSGKNRKVLSDFDNAFVQICRSFF